MGVQVILYYGSALQLSNSPRPIVGPVNVFIRHLRGAKHLVEALDLQPASRSPRVWRRDLPAMLKASSFEVFVSWQSAQSSLPLITAVFSRYIFSSCPSTEGGVPYSIPSRLWSILGRPQPRLVLV